MEHKKIIEDLNWRYATKEFDSSKKISEEDLNVLLDSLKLSPSSFGLQPWKFLVVKNPALREKLCSFAWNQTQVKDASHLIVLCAKKDVTEEYIDRFVSSVSSQRGVPAETLKGYADMMKGFRKNMSTEKTLEWSKKQVYIASGFLMSACARLRIDSCPMEGFSAPDFDKVLGLENSEYTSALVCPIGYRKDSDKTASYKKVRFDSKDVIEFLN